jgi:hypothetical protein
MGHPQVNFTSISHLGQQKYEMGIVGLSYQFRAQFKHESWSLGSVIGFVPNSNMKSVLSIVFAFSCSGLKNEKGSECFVSHRRAR